MSGAGLLVDTTVHVTQPVGNTFLAPSDESLSSWLANEICSLRRMCVCVFICVFLVEDKAAAKVGLVKYSHLFSVFFLLFFFHYFVAEEIWGSVIQFLCLSVNYLLAVESIHLAFYY